MTCEMKINITLGSHWCIQCLKIFKSLESLLGIWFDKVEIWPHFVEQNQQILGLHVTTLLLDGNSFSIAGICIIKEKHFVVLLREDGQLICLWNIISQRVPVWDGQQ